MSEVLPATGRLPLLGAYDRIVALTMRERAWREPLVAAARADAGPDGLVVEVGTGTGTLAIALATATRVVAVDGDPHALALARAKPGADAVDWRAGRAQALPVDDACADVVLMSLLLHHLDPDGKRAALAEARRVLRPGGVLHVADWGAAHDPLMRAAFGILQLVDGRAGTRDHVAGRLPAFVTGAGFERVVRHRRLRTVTGSFEHLTARAPG